MIYTRPPFTIAVTSDSDIHEPADLEGRTIAGPANDGALRLFPAFAALADIDKDSIEIMNIEPRLREQMLNRGQVDAVFGFVNTVRFNAACLQALTLTSGCVSSVTGTMAWIFIPIR
jgi:NitT/TauT family transport system substrate-binding protein